MGTKILVLYKVEVVEAREQSVEKGIQKLVPLTSQPAYRAQHTDYLWKLSKCNNTERITVAAKGYQSYNSSYDTGVKQIARTHYGYFIDKRLPNGTETCYIAYQYQKRIPKRPFLRLHLILHLTNIEEKLKRKTSSQPFLEKPVVFASERCENVNYKVTVVKSNIRCLTAQLTSRYFYSFLFPVPVVGHD